MQTIKAKLTLNNKRVAIVSSHFNELIVSKLFEGAKECLLRHGLEEKEITSAWVPGAFELPQAAQRLAMTGKFDAIICLGCVIRGATTHYDYVCNESAKGISRVALDHKLPVMFGVITTENLEQAFERAGSKAGNKGWEVAMAAIEMINLNDAIDHLE
ncbi:MAG: 6,7-dimethyl-8-ribityllumazine synthase [Bdellovibrionota bacterium]|nr:6,7-dimethyl-8-ribityllumazine synthase [Bdellovibrionota bacterium]